MKKLFILLLLSVALFLKGNAQPVNISFQHYNTENGLSSNLVRNIIQDTYGFLWIGTSDGLNRFDGKTFTTHRYDKNDSTSISNNIINGLATDSSGNIWAATNSGLCYYDYSDDAFHRINVSSYNTETSDAKRVYAVSAGKNNRIWFTTKSSLHVWTPNGAIKTFPVNTDQLWKTGALLVDSKERIWIGTNMNKVLLFDQKSRHFQSVSVIKTISYQPDRTISAVSLLQGGPDDILVATWYAGLQRISVSGEKISINAFIDEKEKDERKWIATSITKSSDSPKHFWISHFGSGISLVDISTGNFLTNIHHDPSNAKSLCNDFVNAVFTDRAGTLWVGTTEGLDKYDELSNRFSIKMIPEFSQAGTVRRQPSVILENKFDSSHQTFWIGLPSAGLFLYSKSGGVLKSFQHSGKSGSLLNNDVYALYISNDQKLFIGTREGVCIYIENEDNFKPLFSDTTRLTPKFVNYLFEDRKNRFWFSSFRNGVYCYNPLTKNMIHYAHQDSLPNSLSDNHVFCLLEDYKGRIWAGTQNNGLNRLNETEASWTHFLHKPGTTNTIPENYIYTLYEDDKNQLWIGTENGLGVMNPETEEVKSFFTSDGLCNNDIFSIHKTNYNHMWLGTVNGLSDFDLSNNTFRNYFTTDGLPTNDISGAFEGMSDGTIYIGVPGGIVFFNPTDIKTNRKIPSVVITAFSIFDKKYPVRRKGIRLEKINLNHRQSMITFNFAVLNFTNPTNNMFAYKLEGLDKDWINCGNKTSATYTNLDGGDYVFKVKGCNNDGVWNTDGAWVMLNITPPFWKTIWFYFLVILLISIILYAIYKTRINQILRLQHIRQHIARDLHDDIGSTLSSISMMSKMASVNPPTDDAKSSQLFSTIGNASSQAMDLMSDIVWSVNPENDKIEHVISRMREYASVMLDAANVSFRVEADKSMDQLVLPMEKRKDFFLIFKEAVNNLAKYSRATEGVIQLSYHNHILELCIKDNGAGFDTEKSFTGNGLKNMKSRAKDLKAKLIIFSKQKSGTTITLSVPLVT